MFVLFIFHQSQENTKLLVQSIKCAFLGYSSFQKGYLCYDSNANQIKISHNVIFLEKQNFFHTQAYSISPSFFLLPNFSDMYPNSPQNSPQISP